MAIAKASADASPPAAHGTSARAASAMAASAGVARSRDAGSKVAGAGAVVVTPGYFGSVETSLSHFVSRRVRSADEPYFAKS